MKRLIALALLALAFAAPARAELSRGLTVKQFVDFCSSSVTQDQAVCAAYVWGILDIIMYDIEYKVCGDIVVGDAIKEAMEQARNYADPNTAFAAPLVTWAVQDRWGCKK